ncbi:response regulator [Helicobacter kayseriensis]|uniref:response regulator n=1 Tax=Helicobacter kayseriensis TaxID=2905877 RepID=UPI001E48957C|nr:response regulator [Helicobacter kayseriensis]MCE3046810.1 response regulator [Helicobacter kayseriensis]MCE3047888.1 response regulator [Helicobacter kayseriensis]
MILERLKEMNLLYVEDDEDTLQASKIILEDYVKTLFIARDGQEALEIFEKQKIDLILTDILMPKLNGIEMIKVIRQKHPNLPIIITTAHTETQYLLDAIHLKVDRYILKPIVLEDLFGAFEKVILPSLQAQTIQDQKLLINAISTFVGGKKIEIIRYLLQNIDEDFIFHGSYESIMETLNVSKPTVVKTFKQLIETGLVTKIRNKIYRLHPDITSS